MTVVALRPKAQSMPNATPKNVIDVKDLSLVFQTNDGPVNALSNINLAVNGGEFVSFIGPSGCGKTTLLRVIADLEQTVPILAIAPMIIVVLNAVNITGLLPKAMISTYLSFFPVAVGMVKGLRSPEIMHLDLMHTYNASKAQVFWKLRWPASMPYLFTSMKIAVAISLVGAIVGELPTGAVAGIGARLLAGSYYGQTVQIWAALIAAALMAAILVSLIGLVATLVNRRMGVRP